MLSNRSLIDDITRIVGAEKVLTDAEDIYVYSFEHLFREKRYTNLIAVVRVSSEEELRKVEELAQEEGVTVVRRSCWKPELHEVTPTTVLIDDVIQPDLTVSREPRKEYRFELQKRLEANGNGAFGEYAFATHAASAAFVLPSTLKARRLGKQY